MVIHVQQKRQETMKKTYIYPTINVVKLNINQYLLIGSPASFDGGGNGSATISDTSMDPSDPEDEVLSRMFNFDE